MSDDRLARHAGTQKLPAPVNGVAYYSDMSGFSVIKGTVNADGTITGTLTSLSGNGPTGNITGKRAKEATDVALVGPGCANARIHLRHFGRYGISGGL